MKKIHINQLGYRPGDPKKAVIPQEITEFTVIRNSDNTVVYSGQAGNIMEAAASLERVREADFSDFSALGEYYIKAGDEFYYPFIISDDPYKKLRVAVLEMFNYQKCGIDLEAQVWSHSACHAEDAVIYGTNNKKDVLGGWHDAGDYGRYIVPAAKAVADLLLGYEFGSNKDNNLPDIVWYEIEWMLKMQDTDTGGVHHKASCRQFNPLNQMPDDEKGDIVVTPVSSTATADFAAVAALASRFYPHKKSQLLAAAKKAWQWLCKYPDLVYENPSDIRTGGYGDDNDKDERFWAACELFAAAQGKEAEEYQDYIIKEIDTNPVYADNPWHARDRRLLSGLGWSNMGTYGIAAYLQSKNKKNEQAVMRLKEELLSDCEKYMNEVKIDPYRISVGSFFPWGSTMIIANNAMSLILGSRLAATDPAKKKQYEEAALEHFHYLLGKNPLSQSYLTMFGSNPAKNPHHRLSVGAGATVPGMVVGGPCAKFDRDPAVNEHCKDAPPAMRYVDNKESFSTNEITIYWNSPFYFLMAALELGSR